MHPARSRGASSIGTCPQESHTSRDAGSSCCHSAAMRTGTRRSRTPQTSSVGARTAGSSARRSHVETNAVPRTSAKGPAAERVGGDHRKRRANVVELTEQGNGAGRNAATARDSGRRDEDEPPCPLAPARGEVGDDEPAERVTGEVDSLERGRIEPPPEPCASAPSRRRVARVSADRRGDTRRRSPSDRSSRRPPAPGTGEAVHEHQRWAGTGDPVPDRPTVDLDLVHIHRVPLQPYVCRPALPHEPATVE